MVRDRVVALLAEAMEQPLTVVSAAAGFGKTTAVRDAVAASEARVAWVSTDPDIGGDVRRLWTRIVTAIERAVPGATGEAVRALLGGKDLIEDVAPLVIEALAARGEERLIVVLDDYQHLDPAADQRSLLAFIDALPPTVRMLVSSRTVPSLRLGRRRAAGTLGEVAPAQLLFGAAETEALLNGVMGLRLDEQQLKLVARRLGGWPAGISLLGTALHDRTAKGSFEDALASSEERIFDYIAEEVADAVDPEMRHFLRWTAIVERVSAPLCETLLGGPNAAAMLAEARRCNLFVTATEEAEGSRYHCLVTEQLRRELSEREPELIADLHVRASAWFEREGMAEEAIAHASAAGDGERAAKLMCRAGLELLCETGEGRVRRLIEAIPANDSKYRHHCEALHVLCVGLEGAAPELIYERMAQLEAVRDAPGVAPVLDQGRIWPFYGRVGEAVEVGRDALDRYTDAPLRVRYALAATLGLSLWFAGEPEAARDLLEPRVDGVEHSYGKIWALATLSLCAADDADPAGAERHARDAIAMVERISKASAIQHQLAYQALAHAQRLGGRHEDAAAVLDRVASVTGALPGSIYHAITLLLRAELALARADRPGARALAAEVRATLDHYPDPGVLLDRLATLEAAISDGAADRMRDTPPTPAEQRLLCLLASDLTLEEIASERLHVSINTVTSHRRRLYRRLGAKTREEAVATARARGLL